MFTATEAMGAAASCLFHLHETVSGARVSPGAICVLSFLLCALLVHNSAFGRPSNILSLTRSPSFVIPPSSYSQQKKRVKIWLYEDTRLAIEGQIIGFDEYMNMTLDDAAEVDTKTGKKVDVGRILLKGDAITLLQEA